MKNYKPFANQMIYNTLQIFVMLILLAIVSCSEREEIKQYAATETYPADTLLQNIQSKNEYQRMAEKYFCMQEMLRHR